MEYNAFTDSFGPASTSTLRQTDTPRSPQFEVGKGGMEVRYDGNGGASLVRDSDQPNTF